MATWPELVEEGRVAQHVPLAPYTTYKLGGPTRLLAEVGSLDDLVAVGQALATDPLPVLVLGRGSNLLVSDTGFEGVVIKLGRAFAAMELLDDGVVRAGAALPLPRLARLASEAGRGGLEWCVGVPGSVGGAVRQNAGCFGSEVVDRLIDCRILQLGDAEPVVVATSDLNLGYRQSNVPASSVVISARFSTVEVDPAAAAVEMRRVTRWRRDHQPGGTLNAGSVFKNPPGDSAGAIIDRLGLKGHAVRGVRVSPRHANFIEADADASAADVRALIEDVRSRVLVTTGIALDPEIQFVGFDGGDGR